MRRSTASRRRRKQMIEVKSFAALRRFSPDKLQKVNLFETERFFCDVYCLEPGQEQKAHAHAGSDKLYAVLEGAVALCPAGSEHGVTNRSNARAALLVFMAPRPQAAGAG